MIEWSFSNHASWSVTGKNGKRNWTQLVQLRKGMRSHEPKLPGERQTAGAEVLNSLSPRRCICNLELVIFKLVSRMDILNLSCEIVNATKPLWWQVDIGSSNGLVPSGTIVKIWKKTKTERYNSKAYMDLDDRERLLNLIPHTWWHYNICF